jgi:pyruvate/2-oxoglutarate dehydrogenase complex dihydrolipoamide acyltransferase (E2) component
VADFIVRIPRASIAISEATLVEVLVEDGANVDEGDPLFVIETEKVESEIQAGASGTVHWTGMVGSAYDVGAEIGVIEASG